MSADKMPALPAVDYWSTRGDDTPLFTADQLHAYARAYAAEQTRELVEALEALLEGAESILGTCGCVRGDTPEDADTFTHDEWAEDFLSERTQEARALIAKHKGAA